MARKSYDRMYREYDVKEFENKVEAPKEEVTEEKIPEKEKDVEIEKKPSSIIGTVVGGASLNVRKNPDGEVVNTIKEGTQVVIVDSSIPDWYKITSPSNGYVMKKFITI